MGKRFNIYDGQSNTIKGVISRHFARTLDDIHDTELYGKFTELHNGTIDVFTAKERHALCRITRDTTDSVLLINVGDYITYSTEPFTPEENTYLIPLEGW